MGTVYKNGSFLRTGYTTGTCAAAASKAAAEMLLSGKAVAKTELTIPAGKTLLLEVEDTERTDLHVSCAVRKDGGDDSDVTHGLLVYADVRKSDSEGVHITGGTGVGKVTKAGLDRPVGDYAINTVPRQMITEAVTAVCEKYGYTGGMDVCIYIPDGERIAEMTYNPRLGIVGGISVIGTTGEVLPMSRKAFLDTVRIEMNMRRLAGETSAILTLGNYGQAYLAKKNIPAKDESIKISNFIGEALDMAIESGFERVHIAGHIGKLVKLGAGIMNTHSAEADGRIEILIYCALMAGADNETLRLIADSVSTDSVLDILKEKELLSPAMEILKERTKLYISNRVKDRIKVDITVFSNIHGTLYEIRDEGD